MGLRDKANASLTRAIELDAELSAAFFQRGILAYQDKRYGQALADFNQAARSPTHAAAALYNSALVRRAQRDRRGALDDVQRALRLQAGYQEALDLQARLLRER